MAKHIPDIRDPSSRSAARARRSPPWTPPLAVTVADLVAFLTHLRSKGVTYYAEDGELTVETRGDGVHQTYFPDPDGHWIEINDFGFSPKPLR